MTLELRVVQTDEEWEAMHDIRRKVLFAPRRHRMAKDYDPNHPDDRAEGNVPHILMLDERPIGVVRLDVKGAIAIVRLVAIVADERGQGYGGLMEKMIAEKAWELGIKQLRVNSAPDAVGFYEKSGWRLESWDAEELVGLASDCVQLVKDL